MCELNFLLDNFLLVIFIFSAFSMLPTPKRKRAAVDGESDKKRFKDDNQPVRLLID
jgi:hypothetical protein